MGHQEAFMGYEEAFMEYLDALWNTKHLFAMPRSSMEDQKAFMEY